nr:pilus assembly protein PilY [uncultured Moraxella sp.]
MKFTPCCSSYQQKLLPRMRYLVAVVASLMIMPPLQADAAQNNIGDLEIYKAAEGGKVTITMMLDTSGSMTQTQVGSDACDLPSGVANTTTSYSSSYDTSATTPSYRRYYCIGRDNRKYYDRLTRLKDAIFALMDSTALDSNKVAIGIGQFSSQSDSNNTTKTADGTSGKIVVPAKLLDNAQRLEIKTAVANMFGGNGTPAANAYAEVGAYMLGETTDDGINRYENYYVRNSNGNYQYCINWSGTSCVTWSSYYSGSNFRASDWSTLSSSDYYGNYYSGYRLDRGFNKSISTSKTNNKYKSPLSSTTSQCDGQGIYFLTDGEPNSSYNPRTLMRAALGSSGAAFNVPTAGNGTLPNGSQNGHGMPEVGAFAQALRTTTSNPKGLNIKTAVVGFGSDFDISKYTNIQRTLNAPVLSQNTALPVSPVIYQDKQDTYFNCSLITDTDAKNACNWGAKSHPLLAGVGGYGEGGFYSAQSTDDVINSIVKFVSDLNQEIPAAPSGTITIPDDPYRVDSQLAVAYYPMVEAKVSEAKVIWPGNVKKYNLNAGTLYGQSNQPLFTGVSGDLNPSTQDLWSDRNYPNANNAVTSGGFYAQLKTPNTGISSVRTLYIEDLTSTGATTTKLRKFAVNTNGKLTLDGNPITDSNTFNDTSTYTTNTVTKLLNFLGFNNISVATTGTDVAKLSGITLTPANATTPIKVVGATIHSAPNAVSYSATLDDDGRVTDSRDDYVLFGSMDGAVHLVNADNYGSGSGGQEKFAVILRKMMSSQPDALVKDATQTAIGAPKAGVDAPWLVTADYKYDFPSKRVNIDTSGSGTTQKGVFAYGGLRMGGEGLYGLNLSNYDSPTMLFSIDASTSGFDRMGQIWSKPTKAKIKTSATDTGTDVLIFGGGYDTCYEDENYQVGTTTSTLTNQRGSSCNRTTNREALGNAVYIINAKTGALIWSATKTANSKGTYNTTNDNLNNSIVGGITVLDRNNDGYMDGIYFADLGGQVFRADFTNAGDNIYAKSTTDNKYTPAVQTSFSNQRVTRILQPRYAIANTLGAITTNADAKYNLRFYERPVVSFFRDDNSKLFAMVNVISGDRSSPLSKIRPIDKADRLYGIIDNDVTKANSIFFANDFTTTNANKQTVVDLADTDLVNVPTALGTMPTAGYSLETKNGVINTLKNNSKKGWYYPLTRFDGYANVLYNKGVGKSEVINSMLYTTVYNPDMSYGQANPCSAQIVGGSERELYCLPYGVCMEGTSTTGTGGFLQAGQGIQELTLGPYSSENTNVRLLIGNTSLTQRSTLDSRFSYGIDNRKDTSLLKTRQVAGGNTSITQTGGDGSAAEYLYRERYTLYPKAWYEVFN